MSGNMKPCPTCDGSRLGHFSTGGRCPTCNGTGTLSSQPESNKNTVTTAALSSQPDPYVNEAKSAPYAEPAAHGQPDPADRITAIVLAMNSAPWSRHEAIEKLKVNREAYARQEVVKALDELLEQSKTLQDWADENGYRERVTAVRVSAILAYKNGGR